MQWWVFDAPHMESWEMPMRRTLRLLLILAVALALPASTLAFNVLGGKWSSAGGGHVKYWIYSGGADKTAWQNAITSWNNSPTPIWMVSAGKADAENLGLRSVTNNSVVWDGIAYLSPCNACTDTYADARLNKFFTDGYGAAKRQSVTEHEMGHVFGLAHTAGQVLMNPSTCGANSRWCTFSINTPRQDDVDGINAIY
jgi:hypothetical protein